MHSELASLFITHGGMNSVNEAIYYGVPMIVAPMRNDQPRVAQQVADLHLGKYLNKRGLTNQQIQEVAANLFQDHSYKKTSPAFSKKMPSSRRKSKDS
nr:nucleotide disphospho-sugar-binding domain-containing protein [Streptococcus massiliensis]